MMSFYSALQFLAALLDRDILVVLSKPRLGMLSKAEVMEAVEAIFQLSLGNCQG